MKTLIISTLLVAFGFTTHVSAQEYKTEVDLIESILGKTKKDFVTANLSIPADAESNSEFWKIYNDYEAKRKETARERVKLIIQYIALYSEGTNDDQGKFMKEIFKLRKNSEKNIEKAYKSIAKHVSPTTALQFFQIEEYIRNSVNASVYENLPLKS